jgi:hypothetical protein
MAAQAPVNANAPKPFFKTITKVSRLSDDRQLQQITWLTCVVLQSFRDVPTEPGIDTVQFCDAAEGLVKIFGE